MIAKHYKRLISEETAARYWALRPADTDNKIIPMQAATA
jgi:hypothetical protein